MKKRIVTTLALISLTGCMQYQWVKPGADKRQEDLAETQCQAQSLKELPPDNQTTGKYTSEDKKDKKNRTTNTSYLMTDQNDSKREILVKDCMYNKGWSQVPNTN